MATKTSLIRREDRSECGILISHTKSMKISYTEHKVIQSKTYKEMCPRCHITDP